MCVRECVCVYACVCAFLSWLTQTAVSAETGRCGASSRSQTISASCSRNRGPPRPRIQSPLVLEPVLLGMMPADSTMTSLVQRIARQALNTFRSPPRIPAESPSFLENLSELRSLMTEVRAADLKLVPRRADASPRAPPLLRGPPPVTYMHICETEAFSMGVFLLRSGASIPLHDHPHMHGVLKVLYGKVRISCFDRLERPPGPLPPAVPPSQAAALRRSVLRSSAEYTEDSGPCVLAPDRDNLHQIDAVDGPSAFMDILAPPYDPEDGRDCHYYRVLTEPTEPQEVWLMEVSQPPDFWCGGEPYPGPEVHL